MAYRNVEKSTTKPK